MKRGIRAIVVSMALVGLILLQHTIGYAADSKQDYGVTPEIETALLNEKWKEVADLLKDIDSAHPSPVLRLLKGHACLALNRNNEALCMFLSVDSDDKKKEWDEWTRKFHEHMPRNILPMYLRGDAQVRLRQWESAIGTFSEALAIQPNHALVLNARGVCYARSSEWDKAFDDLSLAAERADNLAEIHSNLGSLWIQKEASPWEALKLFDKALGISPDYVIALAARGGIKVILDKFEEAENDLAAGVEVVKDKHCLVATLQILDTNLSKLTHDRSEAQNALLAQLANVEPGTQIDATMLKDMTSNMTPTEIGRLKGAADNWQSHSLKTNQVASDLSNVGREWGNKMGDYFGNLTVGSGKKPTIGVDVGKIAKDVIEMGALTTGILSANSARDAAGHNTLGSNLDRLYPGIKHEKTGNMDAFTLGQGEFSKFKKGGAAPKRLTQGPMIKPPWGISTVYGLAYESRQ